MSEPSSWDILHLNLSDGVPALAPPSTGRGLYVVFWWNSTPLGDWYVQPESLPMTAPQATELASRVVTEAVGTRLLGPNFSPGAPPGTREDGGGHPLNLSALANLERPLAHLQERLAEDDPSDASISVVICTRDRPEHLAQCLRALQVLEEPPCEVLVVDNAPTTEATQEVVASMPGVRYVREPRAGLDIARNTGVCHSTGALIAFTDDDVEVHPGWLAGLRAGFYSPEVMAVTGLALPAELETEAQVIFEKHWSFNRGFAPRTFGSSFFERTKQRGVPVWDIGAGANMAFRREVFDEVGYFDERLDVGAAGCSGDSEFWFRILAEGWSCRYEPSAVVFHTHRKTKEGLNRQLYAYMRGHVAAHLVQYEKYRCWGDLRRPLLALPRWYLHLLRRRLRHGPDLRTRTLVPEIAGAVSGVLFYLRNRRPPNDAVAPAEPPILVEAHAG